jgi:hypothetical protein
LAFFCSCRKNSYRFLPHFSDLELIPLQHITYVVDKASLIPPRVEKVPAFFEFFVTTTQGVLRLLMQESTSRCGGQLLKPILKFNGRQSNRAGTPTLRLGEANNSSR